MTDKQRARVINRALSLAQDEVYLNDAEFESRQAEIAREISKRYSELKRHMDFTSAADTAREEAICRELEAVRAEERERR